MDRKNLLSIVFAGIAAAALIALGAVYGVRRHKAQVAAQQAAQDSLVEALPVGAEDLPQMDLEGNYTFKIESDTLSSQFSATVKRGVETGYIVTVLSDYDPETHSFMIDGDRLVSPTFGTGRVTYQELTGRLALEFSKDGNTSTLIKYVK